MIPPITEDDLHAYVDDRLAADRRRQVDGYLAQNPRQEERVRAWQAQRDWVHARFDPVAAEPLPPQLTLSHLLTGQATRASFWSTANWRSAAGFLVALGIGAASGWYGHGSARISVPTLPVGIAALKLETKAAYQVFAPGRIPDQTNNALGNNGISKSLSSAVGFAVTVPDLAGSGYGIIGATILATTHGPAAVLIYRRHKTRLVVLIRKMDVPSRAGRMIESHIGQNNLFTWINNGIGFGVTSNIDLRMLHPIANHIRDAETPT
ncbi:MULTISPECIES: anti-sigma factor family protein [Acidiphilium]|uniref:Transmembrane transcriptional regulator (Anti-sigma factor RsiW) n=1 Tax=Acidiphilium rubrum TaxID=526 RepID=A0A8G2FF39_ACIRU|nr:MULTISPECIES: anti-sigma factor [Acidiphilium]MCW8308728.1 anti-sigma factor [Acidiphilium sp. PA]SIR52025.1 Transmembrane transcriptional regulator (anti-sigma factor RsiW) [Acidiphilium rubrum]